MGWTVVGCSGAPGGSDADAPDSSRADAPGEIAPPPRLPDCGNGRLDDGEECDDGNRLDGDSCDWLCRLGGGEPPAEPDPSVDPYGPIPGVGSVEVEGLTPFTGAGTRIPLVWTGRELAVAVYEASLDGLSRIRFHRFDRAGRPMGGSWSYDSPGVRLSSPELLWTGSDFALFFVDPLVGILFVRLERTGVPVHDPVLVVPEPEAREPSADLAGDGFVLAWATAEAADSEPAWCQPWLEGCAIRVRLLAADGSTEGLPGPVTLEEAAGWPPDVATSEGGFAVTVSRNGTLDARGCPLRLVHLDASLGGAVSSGTLSAGGPAEVHAAAGGYVVDWHVANDPATRDRGHWCVASFDETGVLVRSPPCPANLSSGVAVPVRLAGGDGGYALVAGHGGYGLGFAWTDLAGVEVMAGSVGLDLQVGGFGVAWAGDVFIVAYARELAWGYPLYFTRFGLEDFPGS